MINDDEINCQVPTTAPSGSFVNITFCEMLIKLARLSSLVATKLSSVRAFRQRPEVMVRTVSGLDDRLLTLKSSFQHIFHIDAPIDPARLPPNLNLYQAVYLQFVYYCIVFDIHTALANPWSRAILSSESNNSVAIQSQQSSRIVAETSRAAIWATKNIHLDANTPVP